MAAISQRQLPFFLIASLLAFSQNAAEKPKRSIGYMILIVPCLIICVFFASSLDYIQPDYNLDEIVDIVDYLDEVENGDNTNVFCISAPGGPGSYLEYKGFRPYFDSRAEIFSDKINNKKDIFAERIKYQLAEISYEQIFSEYDFDYAIINNDDLQYDLIYSDDDFELLYKNSSYTLYKVNS